MICASDDKNQAEGGDQRPVTQESRGCPQGTRKLDWGGGGSLTAQPSLLAWKDFVPRQPEHRGPPTDSDLGSRDPSKVPGAVFLEREGKSSTQP